MALPLAKAEPIGDIGSASVIQKQQLRESENIKDAPQSPQPVKMEGEEDLQAVDQRFPHRL